MRMSKDVFEIYEKINDKDLEKQVALQCAPLLTGVKISNLLIVASSKKEDIIKMFNKTEISYFTLHESSSKITFLLYNESKLLSYIEKDESKLAMSMFGYEDYGIYNVLNECRERYKRYMSGEEVFPHELGIILGYPVEDVLGFIRNKGKNYLYSGYWKVYGDLEGKLRVFDSYNEAKEKVLKLILRGFSINSILDIYNQNKYRKIKIA